MTTEPGSAAGRLSAEADLIAATCNALSAGIDAERVLALVHEEIERGN